MAGLHGYVCAGINASLRDTRGSVLLVVDQTMASPLSTELERFIADMEGDGYAVLRSDVARQSEVTAAASAAEIAAVRTVIEDAYSAEGDDLKAVILFGRVAVPYAGNIFPDGHSNHQGVAS